MSEGTLPESVRGQRFGLIVANISGLAIERLAADMAGALIQSGTLIVSGFLEDTVEALSRALAAAGLIVDRVEAEGVWRAITATRAGCA